MPDLTPEEFSRIDEKLTEAVGMHGPWVAVIETYNEEGEPQLLTVWDNNSTRWAQLGLARALVIDIETGLAQAMGGEL